MLRREPLGWLERPLRSLTIIEIRDEQQPEARTGSEPPTNQDQWDWTALNPAYHWSNDAERYCFSDLARIVEAIQNNPNVVVTDPAGVAVTG